MTTKAHIILLVDSIWPPVTGVGRYTQELARELESNKDVTLTLFDGKQLYPSLEEVNALVSATRAEVDSGNHLGHRFRNFIGQLPNTRYIYHSYIRRFRDFHLLKQFKDTIVHGPNFYIPPFSGQSVVNIHDLSVLTYPEFHPQQRARIVRKQLNKSVTDANTIITPSTQVSNELLNHFNIPAEKIVKTSYAARDVFKPREPTATNKVIAPYGLSTHGYNLFVGSVEPRKNLLRLIQAYEILDQSCRQRWPLVIAGIPGWNSQAIHQKIEEGAKAGWVRYIDYVSNDDLPYLYAGARVFIFPSLYEGFGLPILEAMGAGVPVVCSDIPVFREVAASAALFANPYDIQSLAAAITSASTDSSIREQLRTSGLSQAAKFSWKETANQTVDVYQNLRRTVTNQQQTKTSTKEIL